MLGAVKPLSSPGTTPKLSPFSETTPNPSKPSPLSETTPKSCKLSPFAYTPVNLKPDPPGAVINSIPHKDYLINATLGNVFTDKLHGSYMPGLLSLIDSIDQPILVHLRDRRTIIGVLSSIDTWGNILLSNTVERVYAMDFHADIPRGIYLVRGENVALAGEVELDSEDPEKKKPLQQILAWQEAERLAREEKKRRIRHMSYEAGVLSLDDTLEDEFYQ